MIAHPASSTDITNKYDNLNEYDKARLVYLKQRKMVGSYIADSQIPPSSIYDSSYLNIYRLISATSDDVDKEIELLEQKAVLRSASRADIERMLRGY